MATVDILKKLRLYKANPTMVQELTPGEIAEVAILLMQQISEIKDEMRKMRGQ